uniref:Chromo domain-containing protein n=1 Tax=Strongyloides stercoralis TaxID=6248 RepID=A0A0K0EE45_STRER
MSSRSLANDNGRSTSYYLVKEVTDKMYRNGEPWYKVWWEGYPRSESTWEPLSNFLNYIPILEYERKLKTNNFEDDFKKYINSLSNISTRKNYQPVGDGYEHEIYFSKNRQNIINKGIPTHVVRRFNIKKKVLEPNKKHFMNNSLHDLFY